MEKVGGDQPLHADLAFAEESGAPSQYQEADAEQDQAEAEFGRDRRTAAVEPQPQHTHDRGHEDDEHRVDRLQGAGGDLVAEDHPISVVTGKEIHRRAGLLEAGPEERRAEEEQRAYADPLALGRIVTDVADDPGEIDAGENSDDHPSGLGEADQGDRQDAGHGQADDRRGEDDDHPQPHHQLAPCVGDLVGLGVFFFQLATAFDVLLTGHVLDERQGHAGRPPRRSRSAN